MAKSKYYLMTAKRLDGAEAERIGLVSLAVDPDAVQQTALDLAAELALGPADALHSTKRSLGHWYRAQLPAFEASLAQEFHQMASPAGREGVAAIRERRAPDFVTAESG
jgi:enoyl-CoA hydratase